jgi:hypothetical protein
MTRNYFWLALVSSSFGLGTLCGCAELDISHDAPVDFARYRSVTVDVDGSFDGSNAHLASELRDVSGFKTVNVAPDASEDEEAPPTDAYLSVEVRVTYYYDDDGFPVFLADAEYELDDAEGKLLTSDTVSEQGGSANSATQEALDEVARAFIPSYDY